MLQKWSLCIHLFILGIILIEGELLLSKAFFSTSNFEISPRCILVNYDTRRNFCFSATHCSTPRAVDTPVCENKWALLQGSQIERSAWRLLLGTEFCFNTELSSGFSLSFSICSMQLTVVLLDAAFSIASVSDLLGCWEACLTYFLSK